MVNLTRIYTRTGDDGTTALGDFSRTTKNDPRLIAFADVDEANSAIGVVLAMAGPQLDQLDQAGRRNQFDPADQADHADQRNESDPADRAEQPDRADQTDQADRRITVLLRRIQNDLFDVGADLCTPLTAAPPKHTPLRVTSDYIDRLEQACDTWNAGLPALRSFILPGGTPGAAFLHVARTVTRRAERAVWAAIDTHGTDGDGGVNPLTAKYLNRLSDLLFILCRVANGPAGDVLWLPGGPT